MNFDPQIVAQAALFVNALRSGQSAHVPAMPFRRWPVFIGCVRLMMRASA
ncbi:succinate dehydrogenase flavoprotein subunit [Pantoea ananatis]